MVRRLAGWLAGGVVTAGCLLPFSPARAEDAASLVAKGQALVAKKDYEGASRAFLAAVGKDPRSLDARRGAAETLLGLGRADDAVAQAYAGLDLVGDRDAGLWLVAARAFLMKGETLPSTRKDDIDAALSDAKAKAGLALKNDPSLNAARAVLARACRLTGDAERAMKTLAEGLDRDPKDFDLLFEKGWLHLKAGEYTLALGCFGKAAESDPASAETRFQMGICNAGLRQFEEACGCFLKASLLDPAAGRYLVALGKYSADDAARARWFRDLLKQKPDHAWGHAYFAFYLAGAKTKDEAGALEESRKALALAPEEPGLVAWHGQILDMVGKDGEALKYYLKAFNLNPATTLAYNKLAERATSPRSTASRDERKALIRLLGEKRPEEGFFWNDVGLYHRDVTKDYRESLAAYVKAAALLPDDQGVQNDTGLIYLYHGKTIGEDPHRALPYLQRAIQLVDEEGQALEMGGRDSQQNLAQYYKDVEPNPEKALEYATRRNDPAFYGVLKPPLNAPSGEAAAVKQWAENQLKR